MKACLWINKSDRPNHGSSREKLPESPPPSRPGHATEPAPFRHDVTFRCCDCHDQSPNLRCQPKPHGGPSDLSHKCCFEMLRDRFPDSQKRCFACLKVSKLGPSRSGPSQKRPVFSITGGRPSISKSPWIRRVIERRDWGNGSTAMLRRSRCGGVQWVNVNVRLLIQTKRLERHW